MNQTAEVTGTKVGQQREIEHFISKMRDKLGELHHARNRLNSLGDRVAGPEPQADSQEENKELGPNCLMDDLNAIHRKVAFELAEIHGELNRIEKYI